MYYYPNYFYPYSDRNWSTRLIKSLTHSGTRLHAYLPTYLHKFITSNIPSISDKHAHRTCMYVPSPAGCDENLSSTDGESGWNIPLILGPAEAEAAPFSLLLLVMGEGAGSMIPTGKRNNTTYWHIHNYTICWTRRLWETGLLRPTCTLDSSPPTRMATAMPPRMTAIPRNMQKYFPHLEDFSSSRLLFVTYNFSLLEENEQNLQIIHLRFQDSSRFLKNDLLECDVWNISL